MASSSGGPPDRPLSGSQLIVLRCQTCGDTFTLHADDDRLCPTCGGSDVDLTHEPLL